MTTRAAGPLDFIGHLPAGGTLILTEVSWPEYERLLTDLGEGYAVRISYVRGELQIVSPSAKHEKCKELILRIADTTADELDLDLESFGSTTFKREELGQGAEPDTCFYVQNARAVAGRIRIDLDVDPPPDVAHVTKHARILRAPSRARALPL